MQHPVIQRILTKLIPVYLHLLLELDHGGSALLAFLGNSWGVDVVAEVAGLVVVVAYGSDGVLGVEGDIGEGDTFFHLSIKTNNGLKVKNSTIFRTEN